MSSRYQRKPYPEKHEIDSALAKRMRAAYDAGLSVTAVGKAFHRDAIRCRDAIIKAGGKIRQIGNKL